MVSIPHSSRTSFRKDDCPSNVSVMFAPLPGRDRSLSQSQELRTSYSVHAREQYTIAYRQLSLGRKDIYVRPRTNLGRYTPIFSNGAELYILNSGDTLSVVKLFYMTSSSFLVSRISNGRW